MREKENWKIEIEDKELRAYIEKVDRYYRDTKATKSFINKLEPENARAHDLVFSHADVSENNILLRLDDYQKLTIVDFEFGGLDNRAMDLAFFYCFNLRTYKNLGNSPFKTYLEFCLTEEKVEEMLRIYLERFYERYFEAKYIEEGEIIVSMEQFMDEELPIFKEQLRSCLLIAAFSGFTYCY